MVRSTRADRIRVKAFQKNDKGGRLEGKLIAELERPRPSRKAGERVWEHGINLHAMQNMPAAARAYQDEPIFAENARWLLQHYPGQISALLLPLN